MRKPKLICYIIGTMLLLAALFLTLYNYYEDKKSGEASKTVLTEMMDMIPETTAAVTTVENPDVVEDLFAQYEKPTRPDPGLLEINGNEYIGYISIPALEIELPVMNEWNYPNLNIAPCRYKGSIVEDNLIIAAHNFNSHFGRINTLREGDEIIITDAKGYKHRFSIVSLEEIVGTDIDAMDFGSEDSWDLTIFTCTLNSQSRVTVRAVRIEDDEITE